MKKSLLAYFICLTLITSQFFLGFKVESANAETLPSVVNVHNKVEHIYKSLKTNSLTSNNAKTWQTYISDAKKLNSKLPNGSSKSKYETRILKADILVESVHLITSLESKLNLSNKPPTNELQHQVKLIQSLLKKVDINIFSKQHKEIQLRVKKCEDKILSSSITREELSFGIKGYEVKGELVKPSSPPKDMKIAIIVGGSGPTDRNCTSGYQTPYRDIAYGLAEKGIASFRYDKRSLSYPDKLMPNILEFGLNEEYLEDYNEIIKYLQGRSDINKGEIYVIGHSQGGNLIPMMDKTNPSAKGYIFLAANYYPLEDHILRQLKFLLDVTPGITEEYKESEINKLQDNVAKIKTLTTSSKPELILGISTKYWLEYKGYDPGKSALNINKPMLFIQGSNDYNVTLEDLNQYKSILKNKPNTEFKEIEGITHLLAKGAKHPSAFEDKVSVDQRVIESIIEFLNK
ncbi:MAG: alpha/beta hydrolase [Clostridium sp.]